MRLLVALALLLLGGVLLINQPSVKAQINRWMGLTTPATTPASDPEAPAGEVTHEDGPKLANGNLVCPACNGEGHIMIRRGAGKMHSSSRNRRGETIQDDSSFCALCVGRGGRSLSVPPNATICPECLGMGKRLYHPEIDQRSYAGSLSNCYQNGYSDRLPSQTSCNRCLGKGYVRRMWK